MQSLSMGAMDASVVRPNRSLLLLLLFTALLFLGMPDAWPTLSPRATRALSRKAPG